MTASTPARTAAAELKSATVVFDRPGGAGPTVALDDVDITLRDGELLVLVGRSGSGKTTALNVMAGLTELTSGSVDVLGENPVSARKRMGYMFARDALLTWRTARKNVEFGLELRGVDKAQRRQTADELLDRVHLGDYKTNFPSQLSQGQRQRVALARTWATSPEVLLMDEPFAALDAQTRETLHEEMIRLWTAEKRSIVFVTHDLNEAITLADRILVFAHGKIVREFDVDFERPRNVLDITDMPDAKAMYREIHALLAD